MLISPINLLKSAQSDNLQPFSNKQFTMRPYANNRQRLVINRAKKMPSPIGVHMEGVNGFKLLTLQTPLASKDTNIIKPINSSIFRKQNENEGKRRSIVDSNLIRCRSISCLDQNNKIASKTTPSLHKLYSNQQEEKIISKGGLVQMIHSTAREMILQYKQRCIINIRSNNYTLSFENLEDFLLDFGQKIMQRGIPSQRAIGSADNFASKPSLPCKPLEKARQNLKIENIISINEHFRTQKQLSYHSGIIGLHFLFERIEGEKQTFWRLMDEMGEKRVGQEKFAFLVEKMKYLKESIQAQEGQVKQLRERIEDYNRQMKELVKENNGLEEKIRKNNEYLMQVERKVKEIEGFISKQPNRILQQQAEGYKQREQELFDMAFLLEQSNPAQISTFIKESIMIPYESFKLTLSTFANQYINQNDNYVISREDMDSFKNSINTAFGSTINKLSSLIECKASKIKDFVGIMRRLASYTIGKREYLTEINKKMAVVSLNTEQNLKKLEHSFAGTKGSQEILKSLGELKGLIGIMRNIYCEAQVFY